MTLSRKLFVKSTKTMGAIVQSISFRTFLGAPTLKWLFHESYWWNRLKPWKLSLKRIILSISVPWSRNGPHEASGGWFWPFLGPAPKIAPRRLLEAHFEHFWALLPKWLPGRFWRLIFSFSGPCFQNGAQDASGYLFWTFPRFASK